MLIHWFIYRLDSITVPPDVKIPLICILQKRACDFYYRVLGFEDKNIIKWRLIILHHVSLVMYIIHLEYHQISVIKYKYYPRCSTIKDFYLVGVEFWTFLLCLLLKKFPYLNVLSCGREDFVFANFQVYILFNHYYQNIWGVGHPIYLYLHYK